MRREIREKRISKGMTKSVRQGKFVLLRSQLYCHCLLKKEEAEVIMKGVHCCSEQYTYKFKSVSSKDVHCLWINFFSENWTAFNYTSISCIFSLLNISNRNMVRSVGLFCCYLSEENKMSNYKQCVPMVWSYIWILTSK